MTEMTEIKIDMGIPQNAINLNSEQVKKRWVVCDKAGWDGGRKLVHGSGSGGTGGNSSVCCDDHATLQGSTAPCAIGEGRGR